MSMWWMVVVAVTAWPLASLLVGLALGRAIGLRGDDVRAVPPSSDVPLRRLGGMSYRRRDLAG